MAEETSIRELSKGRIRNSCYRDINFAGPYLRRSFRRWTRIENTKFVNCTFPKTLGLFRVNFENCIFESCKFGTQSDPVFCHLVRIKNCVFKNCKIAMMDFGTKGQPSSFTSSSIVGGNLTRFFFKNADFSGTSISSRLERVTIVNCYGSSLDFAGSVGIDASVIGAEKFERIRFPADSKKCVFRSEATLFSDAVFGKFSDELIDPENWLAVKEKIISSQFGHVIGYSPELLGLQFQFKDALGLDLAMDALRRSTDELLN